MAALSRRAAATTGAAPFLLSLLLPVLMSLLLLLYPARAYKLLEDQSFAAPFDTYNSAGSRVVASYREGGHAKVNEHFVRLTPDRQSKQGHLWNSRRVDAADWSVVMEFRVSGQAKSLFGDGLAFWFTDMPNIRRGELFGVADDFKGFAVILDTFRNQESAAVHKDISVLKGDGKPGASDRRNVERPGCDADFRYYEGADNFNVAKSVSYAKFSLKARTLTVSLDARAAGKFQTCFTAQNVLPDDFDPAKGFFGFTGTTGGLADNHDVLAVRAYKLEGLDKEGPDPELHFSKVDQDLKLPPHETVGDAAYDPEAALRSMIKTEKKISESQINDVKHYVEHSLSAIKDELKKIIGKVDKKVEGQEDHMKSLDKIVDKVKEDVANQVGLGCSFPPPAPPLPPPPFSGGPFSLFAFVSRAQVLPNTQSSYCNIPSLPPLSLTLSSPAQLSQDSVKYVEERITQLQNVMESNVQRRLAELEKKLNMKSESIEASMKRTAIKHVESHVKSQLASNMEDAVAKMGSSSWVYAFVTLSLFVCCGFGFLLRKVKTSGGAYDLPGMGGKSHRF